MQQGCVFPRTLSIHTLSVLPEGGSTTSFPQAEHVFEFASQPEVASL